MAHPEDDALAMPPPQHLPDSQESFSSTNSSTKSFATANRRSFLQQPQYTPLSSQSQTSQTALRESAPSSQNAKQLPPYSPRDPSETRASSNSSPSLSGSPTHGTKRTANGLVKRINNSQIGSPEPLRKVHHSRTWSLDTNGSSVSELTGQLKSKLSSAWSKVQSRESASILASPVSASTEAIRVLPNGLNSPRTAMANANRHSRNLSQIVNGHVPADSNLARSTENATPLSESYQRRRPSTSSGLAPAPELSTFRRVNNVAPPPRLQVPQSLSLSDSHPAFRRATTPTQQEKDAVESLLLMGSPSHPGRFQREEHSNQPSPLRSDFSRQHHPMRTLNNGMPAPGMSRMTSTSSEEGFNTRPNGYPTTNGHPANSQGSILSNGFISSQESEERRRAKRRSIGNGLRTEKDVDYMLDLMAREVRSDSEDAPPVSDFSARHQRVNGQVNGNGVAGRR